MNEVVGRKDPYHGEVSLSQMAFIQLIFEFTALKEKRSDWNDCGAEPDRGTGTSGTDVASTRKTTSHSCRLPTMYRETHPLLLVEVSSNIVLDPGAENYAVIRADYLLQLAS
jgi:hypothetical protein